MGEGPAQGGTGHAHATRCLLLGEPLGVHQPEGLEPVHRENKPP